MAKQQNNRNNQKDNQKQSYEPTTRDKVEHGVSVFKVIMLIVLAVSVFAILLGREPVTLQSFLKMLQSAPQIDMAWLNWGENVLGDWGAFNFLRNFLETIIGLANVGAFVGSCLVQTLLYLLYFLRWLFL